MKIIMMIIKIKIKIKRIFSNKKKYKIFNTFLKIKMKKKRSIIKMKIYNNKRKTYLNLRKLSKRIIVKITMMISMILILMNDN